ncbi:MAG: transglutaminase-like domain-containing protein [Bacteroidales bacterium]|nr:transglutaminase-like domain-containing protein [Bacteroidales bacterium]MCF8405938.1 transglutaminase-like domain-containing protein [Bacteroidales bacterium]
MKKVIIIFSIIILIIGNSCHPSGMKNKNISPEKINNEIEKGNYTLAENLIDRYLSDNSISEQEVYEWNYQKDLMNRIRVDFSQTEDELFKYMSQYYPGLEKETMREWEEQNFLELKIIDGERRYFKNAGRNFFRINAKEEARRIAVDGEQNNNLRDFCKQNAVKAIEAAKMKGDETVDEKSFNLNYKLTVDANVVPENEIIRCWLPYPRIHEKRLPEIEFVSASSEEYILADNSKLQRSIYMEKVAVKDEATTFELSFRIKTAAQWFSINPEEIVPYNKESELYKFHTAGRDPHVVFTEELIKLTDSIVGDEQNPFLTVRLIYTWIDNIIPWASALEYGIINNIPEYVLENRHGDCGMQSLLFMTMAKYKGIPAKWQSGWMLHPGEVNLHDWAEVYFEGIGWVPVDMSFSMIDSDDADVKYFYANGIDAYRLIVNDDYARNLYPAKIYPRSEPYDFQRGEVEWKGGNLYFDKWDYHMDVEYLDQ